MDNLTHSLVGALIGQMGLKRKTGLAMPTLIIAANIPDIDAVATLLGGHQHLAIRRGITHGPIAMVVLPLLLWGIMLWFDRWQTRRGKRPDNRLPIHKGWLLALAYIGCLSHPLFDWFNSYGVRLLEPFSSQWFYGDTIFIIDIWLWAALIAAVSMSLRRERKGEANWRVPAIGGFVAICAYVYANGLITSKAEATTVQALQTKYSIGPTLVVANPVPIQFWKREILWRDRTSYGSGSYDLFSSRLDLPEIPLHALCMPALCPSPKLISNQHNFNEPVWSDFAKSTDPSISAYLFWSRMPVIEVNDSKKSLSDQRFTNPVVADRFRIELKER